LLLIGICANSKDTKSIMQMSSLSTPKSRPTVLIVDDTSDTLQLISGLLKDSYRLKVANSGAKALKLAKAEPLPDLILLDVMMPEMDGYEVCRVLKDDPSTQSIPIIFLTARSDVEDENEGLTWVRWITFPNQLVRLSCMRESNRS